MIFARRTPKAASAERWKTYYADRADTARRKHENRLAKNLDLVLRLDFGRKKEFKGRQYGVPVIPWDKSVELFELKQNVLALPHKYPNPQQAAEAAAEARRILARILALAKELMVPPWRQRKDSRFRRWLWKKLPNPFAHLPAPEVVQLVDFFSKCQEQGLEGRVLLLRCGTSRPTSFASLLASPSGASVAALSHGRPS